MSLGLYYVGHCVVYEIYHLVSSLMIMLFRERVYCRFCSCCFENCFSIIRHHHNFIHP